MRWIAYYLGFFFIRFISFLPLKGLFLLSDILWPIIYYLIGYRKKIVYQNIRNSFPGFTEKQVKKTARKFYRHFTDLIFEIIKTIDLSPEEIRRRMRLTNPEILHELHRQNKHIILVASHYGNWEWIMGLAGATNYHTVAVYKPLENKRVDNIMKKVRSKAGTEVVAMRWVLKLLAHAIQDNKLTLSLFVADQSPVRQEIEYWTRFLNQETPVFIGIERIAKRFNMAVLFCETRKVKRGFYEVNFVPVSLDPNKEPEHAITEKHLHLLENLILEEPAFWLWSHRRWKLKRENC